MFLLPIYSALRFMLWGITLLWNPSCKLQVFESDVFLLSSSVSVFLLMAEYQPMLTEITDILTSVSPQKGLVRHVM